MLKKLSFLIVMVILCFIVVIPAAAQEPSHVRFAHYVFNGPQINIFADETIFNGEDGKAYGLNAFDFSRQYLDLSADTAHTFAVVEAGKTVDKVLFKPEAFTLKAGSNYALVVMGNIEAKDLHFILLDETAALAAYDTKLGAVSFVINNLHGLPAVDLYFAGKLMSENLAYGDYVVAQDPAEGLGSKFTPHNDPKTILFELPTPHNDPKTILFELPDAIPGPAQTIAFFGIAGNYPGTLWEDYTIPYAGNYIGKPVFRDGGSIAVGDSIKVNLSEAGLRYNYKLVLDKNSVLDMSLKGGGPESGADSVLRIYDTKGTLVAQNDDFDRFKEGTDAGFKGLKLDKGSYVIEAASSFDTFLGDYTLSITASK